MGYGSDSSENDERRQVPADFKGRLDYLLRVTTVRGDDIDYRDSVHIKAMD